LGGVLSADFTSASKRRWFLLRCMCRGFSDEELRDSTVVNVTPEAELFGRLEAFSLLEIGKHARFANDQHLGGLLASWSPV
jgi:hypothetical protein